MGKWVLYTQPNCPPQTHPFDTPNFAQPNSTNLHNEHEFFSLQPQVHQMNTIENCLSHIISQH